MFGSLNWADSQVRRLANMRAGQHLPHPALSVQATPQPHEARERDLETYQARDSSASAVSHFPRVTFVLMEFSKEELE